MGDFECSCCCSCLSLENSISAKACTTTTAGDGQTCLTFKELAAIRARLQHDMQACIQVLRQSTNPVFLLWNMVSLFTSETLDVDLRREMVMSSVQYDSYCPILEENRFLCRNFEDLTAKDVALVFYYIDKEFFCGSISGRLSFLFRFRHAFSLLNLAFPGVFKKHKRVIMFRVSGDEEMKTQGGRYSRNGNHDYITINKDMLLRAIVGPDPKFPIVCGRQCDSRLECLVRILEHELCHLIGICQVFIC